MQSLVSFVSVMPYNYCYVFMSLCRSYFIAGGISQRNLLRDTSARCFTLNVETGKLTEVAHMNQNRFEFILVNVTHMPPGSVGDKFEI
jgi:hypothetical protein